MPQSGQGTGSPRVLARTAITSPASSTSSMTRPDRPENTVLKSSAASIMTHRDINRLITSPPEMGQSPKFGIPRLAGGGQALAAGGVEQVVVALALTEQQPAVVQQVGLVERAVLADHGAVNRRRALGDRPPGVGERRRQGSRRQR